MSGERIQVNVGLDHRRIVVTDERGTYVEEI